jgi:hypothetical protein
MVHPGPSLFVAIIDPPIAMTNLLTRAKPIPVPLVVLVREEWYRTH